MRRNRTARVAAALAALALLASACSSPQGTEQPENSLLGKKNRDGANEGRAGKGRGPGKGSGGKTKTGQPEVVVGDGALPSVAPGEKPPGSSGADKTETVVESTGGADPRGASVLVTEPDPDAEKSGLAPDYSEIVSVRIEGLATRFRVTLTFRGNLPEQMPDEKTFMIAGMGFTEKKKDEGYGFGASADTTGWTPYAGSKDERGEFPGTLSIDGPTMVFTMPWSAIGGPRSFEWYAQASWFKSLAGTTHYSLDIVPNDGPARFPAG